MFPKTCSAHGSQAAPPKFDRGFAKITIVRLKKKARQAEPKEEPRQELRIEPDQGGLPSLDESGYQTSGYMAGGKRSAALLVLLRTARVSSFTWCIVVAASGRVQYVLDLLCR